MPHLLGELPTNVSTARNQLLLVVKPSVAAIPT